LFLFVEETKMATGGGQIYLFFFFWFASLPERQIWPLVAGSLPLVIGVDCSHPQWPDLSFFLFFFFGNVAKGGRWVVALFTGGGRWIIYLVA
jgi:hypothetical protein